MLLKASPLDHVHLTVMNNFMEACDEQLPLMSSLVRILLVFFDQTSGSKDNQLLYHVEFLASNLCFTLKGSIKDSIPTASQKRNHRRSLKRKDGKEMQAEKKDVSGDKEKPSSGDKEKASSGVKKDVSGDKEKPSPPPPSSNSGSRQGKILPDDELRVKMVSLIFRHPLVSEEENFSPSSIICSRQWEYEARGRLNNFLEKLHEEFKGFNLNDHQRQRIGLMANCAVRGFEKRARRIHEREQKGKAPEEKPSSEEKLSPPSPISGSRQVKILPEDEAKLNNLLERVHENLKPFNLSDYQRQMIEIFATGARLGFKRRACRLHEPEQNG